MRDTLTVDAACMRLVQGEEGGGRLKTGDEVRRLRRLTQHTLPCLTALLRKKAAKPGLACLVAKNSAATGSSSSRSRESREAGHAVSSVMIASGQAPQQQQVLHSWDY
jgi:hypothetical protein